VCGCGRGREGRREGGSPCDLVEDGGVHAYVALNSGQKHLQHLFVCPKKETTGTRAAAEALQQAKEDKGKVFAWMSESLRSGKHPALQDQAATSARQDQKQGEKGKPVVGERIERLKISIFL